MDDRLVDECPEEFSGPVEVAELEPCATKTEDLKGVKVKDDFTEKTWKEDFTLIVEGKKLFVAKNILGLVSPVFEKMFQSEFKEGTQAEIELPEKKLDDVCEFLRCIYPNKETRVSEKNVYKILSLADEYQVLTLKSKCEAVLMNSLKESSSASEIYRLLNTASTYSITQLMDAGIKLASERSLDELDRVEKVVPISLEVKNVIDRKKMEKLQATVGDLKEELQIMKTVNNFHRGGIKKVEQLNAEDYIGWKGLSKYFTLDLNKLRSRDDQSCEIEARVCKVDMKWTFTLPRYCDGLLMLKLELDSGYLISRVSVIFKVVLKNVLEEKQDYFAIYKNQFSRMRQTKQFAPGIPLRNSDFCHYAKVETEIHLLAFEHDYDDLEQ